jgi:hypothetical protein
MYVDFQNFSSEESEASLVIMSTRCVRRKIFSFWDKGRSQRPLSSSGTKQKVKNSQKIASRSGGILLPGRLKSYLPSNSSYLSADSCYSPDNRSYLL